MINFFECFFCKNIRQIGYFLLRTCFAVLEHVVQAGQRNDFLMLVPSLTQQRIDHSQIRTGGYHNIAISVESQYRHVDSRNIIVRIVMHQLSIPRGIGRPQITGQIHFLSPFQSGHLLYRIILGRNPGHKFFPKRIGQRL